jgi:polar amino acid transport system substrate-binding protein
MKRTLIVLLLLLALMLSACGAEKAANRLEAIKQAGVIKVGTSADYPPFESVDASGNKIGFDIELMAEIAKRMGVELEWVDMPFDSLIAGVQENKIDASISAFNYTEERDQMVDFSIGYFTSEDSFTVADSFTGQIANPEDVANYKVGVQTGTTQDTWLTENMIGAGKMKEENLFRYDRVDQAALDLTTGRIEVLMSDYIPAQSLVQQVGGLKILWHGVLSTGPVNIVLPQGEAELKAEIDRIIQELQNEGFIDALAVKWFSGQ